MRAGTCIFCLVSVAGCSHLQSVTKLPLDCMYFLSSDLAPSFSRSPWFHISSLEEKDGEMMEGLLETMFPDTTHIRNHTVHVTDTEGEYERLVSDVWVGIVLILMILSCIGCVCSCLLYHKFQQWKHHSSGASRDSSPEIGEVPRRPSNESLPSYTLVTGLPTYEQALEQAKLGVCLRPPPASLVAMAPPPPISPAPKMPPPPFHEVKS